MPRICNRDSHDAVFSLGTDMDGAAVVGESFVLNLPTPNRCLLEIGGFLWYEDVLPLDGQFIVGFRAAQPKFQVRGQITNQANHA
jgi:hypothetical protein